MGTRKSGLPIIISWYYYYTFTKEKQEAARVAARALSQAVGPGLPCLLCTIQQLTEAAWLQFHRLFDGEEEEEAEYLKGHF